MSAGFAEAYSSNARYKRLPFRILRQFLSCTACLFLCERTFSIPSPMAVPGFHLASHFCSGIGTGVHLQKLARAHRRLICSSMRRFTVLSKLQSIITAFSAFICKQTLPCLPLWLCQCLLQ